MLWYVFVHSCWLSFLGSTYTNTTQYGANLDLLKNKQKYQSYNKIKLGIKCNVIKKTTCPCTFFLGGGYTIPSNYKYTSIHCKKIYVAFYITDKPHALCLYKP